MHPLDVELHVARLERKDVAQAGEPRARVIDRELDVWPEALERGSNGRVIIDAFVLGQLENDRPLRRGDDFRDPRTLHQHLGRDIDAERLVRRQRRGSLDRPGERRALHRQSEAIHGRVRELDVGRDPIVESSQRLDRDRLPGVETTDRLDVCHELVARDDPPEPPDRCIGRLCTLYRRAQDRHDKVRGLDEIGEAVRQRR